jgi:hypothetical protein
MSNRVKDSVRWGSNSVSQGFAKDTTGTANTMKSGATPALPEESLSNLTKEGSIKPLHETAVVAARMKGASESLLPKAAKERIVPENNNYPESLHKNRVEDSASESTSQQYANKEYGGSSSLWERTKSRTTDLLQSVWQMTALAVSSAGATVTSALRRGVEKAALRARQRLAVAKTGAVHKMKESFRAVQSGVGGAMSSTLQAIAQPIRNLQTWVTNKWQTIPVWNRFWWWSLAAIGVYGIATTVPKEVVRLTIQQQSSSAATAKGTTTKENKEAASE